MDILEVGLWLFTAAVLAVTPVTLIYFFWKQRKDKGK